jgi:cyclophilin family peptidyl-prolyl cis-trans isomerase
MSYKTNPKVYLDVQIGASEAGRIIFELFMDLTPKTVENFRGLCTGEYGKVGDVRLHYLNTKFHRICDNFVIQGGDITGGGGTGGFSIYGRTFIDENFARRHSCAGLLSMANCGRNSNSSQFFITLKACPHLDGKHVVFGQVIDGMETVRKMAKVPVDKMDKPKIPIIILDCGEVGDFKAFLKHDPFKKSVFDQIRQRKENIIKEQHKIRKLLEQGIDPNSAYENKTKLEKCEE